MIDTIVLTLPIDKVKIPNHDIFSPSTLHLFEPPYIKVTGKGVFKAVCNPTKAQILMHGYLPRLTFFKARRQGGYTIFIKIEFSIPKLKYNNNFEEVTDQDLDKICYLLNKKLLIMGLIVVDPSYLKNAEVSAVHYSKNIILNDYTSVSSVLKEISKVSVNRHLDVSQSTYLNDGYGMKWHTNSFELIFYDKLKDLIKARKSEKRAIEKDNFIQLDLFGNDPFRSPFEVLRIEARLGNKKKIKQMVSKYHSNFTNSFEKLYSSELSMRLLMFYIDILYQNYIPVPSANEESNLSYYEGLVAYNPHLKTSNLLKYIGAKSLINELGANGFRDLILKYGKIALYRLRKEMRGLKYKKKTDPFEKIMEQITEYIPVKSSSYKVQE